MNRKLKNKIVTNEQVDSIRKVLINQGYENKPINYLELKELHKLFINDVTESEFAVKILCISKGNYANMRTKGTRAIVLKKQNNINRLQIQDIQDQIREELGDGIAINYDLLQQLHKKYLPEMQERIFAQEILEISLDSYNDLKKEDVSVKIMVQEKYIDEVQINKAKTALINDGYMKKIIDYSKIQELHIKYFPEITEREFAIKVLGIAEFTYNKAKNEGKNIKILTKESIDYTLIQEIRKDLLEQGYEGKIIDSAKFKELNQKYAPQIEESVFAQTVLQMTEGIYRTIQKKGKRGTMLRNENINTIIQEKIEKVRTKLIEEGYSDQVINYEQFKILHNTYLPEISERKFASKILMIGEVSFKSMKNTNKGIRVLKTVNIMIDNELKQLKAQIKKEYKNRNINYEDLKYLHSKYAPDLKISTFAKKVLDIEEKNYQKIKNGKFIEIFKEGQKEIVKEDNIISIKNELINDGYARKKVKYEELKILHQKYLPLMDESAFAQKVLELSYTHYIHIKNGDRGGTILKKATRTIDKIHTIKSELKKKGLEGRKISYNELQELHQKYLFSIDEKTFAQDVLGIEFTKYIMMQNKGEIGIIKDKEIVLKTNEIKEKYLQEKRYYTYEEIEKICKYNNITIEQFIKYIILNCNSTELDEMVIQYGKSMFQNKELWIGDIELEEDISEKYIDDIYNMANIATNNYQGVKIYNSQSQEDAVQELVVYTLQNCGDIEKNFKEEKSFKRGLYNKMNYYLNETLLNNSNINLNEQCILRLKELVEKKIDKTTALSQVREEFNLSREELIEMMTDYINIKRANKKQAEER